MGKRAKNKSFCEILLSRGAMRALNEESHRPILTVNYDPSYLLVLGKAVDP